MPIINAQGEVADDYMVVSEKELAIINDIAKIIVDRYYEFNSHKKAAVDIIRKYALEARQADFEAPSVDTDYWETATPEESMT